MQQSPQLRNFHIEVQIKSDKESWASVQLASFTHSLQQDALRTFFNAGQSLHIELLAIER
jgi:hypothetical protein